MEDKSTRSSVRGHIISQKHIMFHGHDIPSTVLQNICDILMKLNTRVFR